MSYEVTLAISIAQAFRARTGAPCFFMTNCGKFSAAVLTAAKRPSAFKPESPFTLFVKAGEAGSFVLNSLFISPDCGLPTEAGDALDHVVLNLESLFVMKIEPKTIAGAGIVPTD